MRADLDHLPHRQQHELERIRITLLTEFKAAIHSGGGGTQSWRRDGKRTSPTAALSQKRTSLPCPFCA